MIENNASSRIIKFEKEVNTWNAGGWGACSTLG